MEHGEIDLSERLRNLKGGMDENLLRVIWAQMLKAVNAIHTQRIIHGKCLAATRRSDNARGILEAYLQLSLLQAT